MLERHLLRSIVLQSLFEWDVRKDNHKEDIQNILLKNVEDFAQTDKIPSFAQKVINCVFEKQKDLDNIIQKAAPQWPIEKIPVIDRNILRIGICELLYSDRKEVPPKVAINEAIELSKAFGGENSGRFISGVMGTIYKELGEPQKHETSESRKKEVNKKDMVIHELGGAMVYSIHNESILVALTHNIFGYWSLVKGKKEEDESIEKCVIRKAKNKLGLDIEIENKLGKHEYVTNHTEDGYVRRKSTFYLAKSKFSDLDLDKNQKSSKVIDDIRWFHLGELKDLEFYDDMRPIIKKGIEILKKKK